MTDHELLAILQTHAPLTSTALCPSLRAFHAHDELPLWEALEAALGARIDAPFFAVAWPGAQAVARVVIDGGIDVVDKVVVDLGCGSGIASVAAKMMGAKQVIGVDIDDLALSTTRLLAREHGVDVDTMNASLLDDAIDDMVDGADVLLAADLVYNRDLGAALAMRARRWIAAGRQVVLADSGRPFFDDVGLPVRAMFSVPVPRGVEGKDVREVRVFW